MLHKKKLFKLSSKLVTRAFLGYHHFSASCPMSSWIGWPGAEDDVDDCKQRQKINQFTTGAKQKVKLL